MPSSQLARASLCVYLASLAACTQAAPAQNEQQQPLTGVAVESGNERVVFLSRGFTTVQALQDSMVGGLADKHWYRFHVPSHLLPAPNETLRHDMTKPQGIRLVIHTSVPGLYDPGMHFVTFDVAAGSGLVDGIVQVGGHGTVGAMAIDDRGDRWGIGFSGAIRQAVMVNGHLRHNGSDRFDIGALVSDMMPGGVQAPARTGGGQP